MADVQCRTCPRFRDSDFSSHRDTVRNVFHSYHVTIPDIEQLQKNLPQALCKKNEAEYFLLRHKLS